MEALFARASVVLGRIVPLAKAKVFTPVKGAFFAGAFAAMPVTSGDDFFEHKFVTDKNPDDIIDFYSTEDFLQILGIFPLAIHFVLAGVQWDTERENTMSVHNAMEISFTLEEREEENEDGEKMVAFFQKRERFKNYIPFTPFLMWDQIQCYGYNRRQDGKTEVFHRGEIFNGPLPIRLLVQLHAYYVIWATQKHINSLTFGNGNLEQNEHQRSNIPLHVLRDFFHRLSVAQQIAIESGKLAAGTSTKQAEDTLKVLKGLKASPDMAYISKRSNLRRTKSQLEIEDPEAQAVVNAVLKNLGTTPEGQSVAKAALDDLVRQEMEVQEPRYGGAFNARVAKLRRFASTA